MVVESEYPPAMPSPATTPENMAPMPRPPPKLPDSVLTFIRLPPRADSSNADWNTALVELSACSLYDCCSSAVIDSWSRTDRVSRSSEIAIRCCSPGASGRE